MEYQVAGRIEHDTAMSRSFTILSLKGIEIDAFSYMLQEGLDCEECEFITTQEDAEKRFQPQKYFDLDSVDSSRRGTIHLDGIDPTIFVEKLRDYAKSEGVQELSDAAYSMAVSLEQSYEKRISKIETYLARASLV